MPTSAAAIEGIKDNGLRWRHEVRLSDLSDRLGREDDLKVGDVASIQEQYVTRVRRFMMTAKLTPGEKAALELVLSDLEDVDDDIDAIRFVLNELYDCFDYVRICAV